MHTETHIDIQRHADTGTQSDQHNARTHTRFLTHIRTFARTHSHANRHPLLFPFGFSFTTFTLTHICLLSRFLAHSQKYTHIYLSPLCFSQTHSDVHTILSPTYPLSHTLHTL